MSSITSYESELYIPLQIGVSARSSIFEREDQISSFVPVKYPLVLIDLFSSKSFENVQSARDSINLFLIIISSGYHQEQSLNLNLQEIKSTIDSGKAFGCVVLYDETKLTNDFLKSLPKVSDELFIDSKDKSSIINKLSLALESYEEILNSPKTLASIARSKAVKASDTLLDLKDKGLKQVPFELKAMPWISTLHLDNNQITEIANLDTLLNLTSLTVTENHIRTITGLEKLKNLEFLDMEVNEITEIQGIEENSNLITLGLSNNKIKKLSGIAGLLRLETLYLSRNELVDIDDFPPLPNLKRIVLSDNKISSIRAFLDYYINKRGLEVKVKYAIRKNEEGIFIYNNPISDPPIEVVSRGNIAIIDHFRKEAEFQTEKLEVLKLILVGNSGVGKTNLCQFLTKRKVIAQHQSTELLEIREWRPKWLKPQGGGKPMRVNIFDFGGQDYYHDSHRLYFSHDTLYILLWDASCNCYKPKSNRLSDGTEISYDDYPLEYWLESIQYNLRGKTQIEYEVLNEELVQSSPMVTETNAPNRKRNLTETAPVLVLQNKIDLKEDVVDQILLTSRYSNISRFFNISLKKKKRTKVLEEVIDDCIGQLKLSGRRLISYQHALVEYYLEHAEEKLRVLTLQEFRDSCVELLKTRGMSVNKHVADKFDLMDACTIANVLSNLGVFCFQASEGENPDPNDKVFTHVGQLNELIKKIMRIAKKGKPEEKGRFIYQQVVEEKIAFNEEILQLLIKNGSVIETEPQQYVVPQFLSDTPDNITSLFIRSFTNCNIRYVYTAYFHKTLVMSLFGKFLRPSATMQDGTVSAVAAHYWQNGLVLARVNEMVFVHFIKEEKACRIEVRTLFAYQNNPLEAEVVAELDRLNTDWTHTKEVSIDSRYYISASELSTYPAKGRFTFQLERSLTKEEAAGPGKTETKLFKMSDFRHLVFFPKLPKKLFISYSSRNSDFAKRFWTHLEVLKNAGHIEPWYDRKIEVGTKWDDTIRQELANADLVIFLLSPDFLATPYIMEVEVKKALERNLSTGQPIFFVELLPCGWLDTELKGFQGILNPGEQNKSLVTVNTADNDKVWMTVVGELKKKLDIKV